jgi:plasmid stabilization system protein ParE
VPAHAYRLGLTVGVQPAAAATLFDGVGTGLPQRFLWAETIDLQAPEHRPDRPAGSLPCDLSAIPCDPQPNTLDAIYQAGTVRGALGYTTIELGFPDEAYRESDMRRLAVLHGAGVQPLDSHAMQVKAKVSALLALLDGRMAVSVEDWQLAGQIMDESTRVRDRCLELMHSEMQRQKADYIADSDEARAQAESRKLETAKRSVLSQLERHDPGHEGIKGYDISRMLGRNGKSAYDAIEALYEAGELDMILDGDRTSNRMWALSS